MNEFLSGRPGDERGFVHKKLLGFVGKAAGIVSSVVPIPGLGIAGRVATKFAGRSRSNRFVPRTELARGITETSLMEKRLGAKLKLGEVQQLFGGPALFNGGTAAGACPEPLVLAPDGHCVARGSGHFIQHFGGGVGAGAPVGDAVMGRYGAALTPGSLIIDRAVCLKGMQLGDDGFCYNKSQISNKQRMWPAGRRPLLTGGDMRAISTAARAGRRLEGATKRLQRLGMMKKPAPRRIAPPTAPPQHQRLLEAHVTK